MTFEEKVIDAFQMAGTALERYEKQASDQEAREKAALAEIPGVVEELVRFGRIEPTEKEAAMEALKDHSQVLQLMKKLASHKNAAEVATLGEQVDRNGRPAGQQKRASSFEGGGYVGRRTSEEPASWQRFRDAIGV